MTKEEFKSKVQYLHTVCGVPYSEIGKRLGVTGQYISLMANEVKPISGNILYKAAQCNMLNNVFIGGEVNERCELETHNNK